MSRSPKLSPESSSKLSFACTSHSRRRHSLVSGLSHRPPELRPRERVLRGDASRLAPHELLALLLGTGHPREGDALQLAEQLLQISGGLNELTALSPQELLELRGLGPVKVSRLLAASEIARRFRQGEPTPLPRPEAPEARWARGLRSSWSGEQPMALAFSPPDIEGALTLSLEGALESSPRLLLQPLFTAGPTAPLIFVALRDGDAPTKEEQRRLTQLFSIAAGLEIPFEAALIVSGERHWLLYPAEETR